ncbi:MAG TPA: exodeoxyribonuclease VII small subunit [Candidatus Desulfofervidus auxilii]|uniref:Exodeoxyribonuclease 7 small subunit n=1 Tax=Desulfofervidus auxilii TaxID=1621989 RepID=A0A7C0U2Z7_DESA2|nr:exodeoxyribonuclease VII small subunit [Candidatus Desulfofervidus auxilii]HDD44604.1 exodeoxyribonuclease VII small subunit [Candidatus Desulfofervidus auxilii]
MTLPFEEAIKRLEEIVKKLEAGEIPLEESLKLFEEGMNLIRYCQQKLDEVEKKVELLVKNERGEFETKPFNPESSLTDTQVE